ncbi:hypothetical protein [Priestia endophytica]|uniref:hypothetical protein n=1 Tax=Priestia endophytica TaxID=135735 RepID=UPI0022810294|nr:hypothetical protein [Priestia endophytica]MCY8234824.1 hypothetical protein [Priestia endophytica]
MSSAFSSGASKVGNIFSKTFQSIVKFISGLGKTFYKAGRGLVEMMAKGIQNSAYVLKQDRWLAQQVRDFLPFSPAKVGPLSDLDHLDFWGPTSDSLTRAMPNVKRQMASLPTIGVASSGATAMNTSGSTEEGHRSLQMCRLLSN